MVANIRSEVKKLKQFYSKRNRVYLCSNGGSEYVVKEFMDQAHYYTERRIYRMIQGRGLSPELLGWSDEHQRLEVSYINGKTVIEALENYEKKGQIQEAIGLLEKVLLWLETFYESIPKEEGQLVYQDINLRNFLLYEDRIYGIDFECCEQGDERYELVKVIAMYLQYTPIESAFKKRVAEKLMELYFKKRNYRESELLEALQKETKLIKKRRSKG